MPGSRYNKMISQYERWRNAVKMLKLKGRKRFQSLRNVLEKEKGGLIHWDLKYFLRRYVLVVENYPSFTYSTQFPGKTTDRFLNYFSVCSSLQ